MGFGVQGRRRKSCSPPPSHSARMRGELPHPWPGGTRHRFSDDVPTACGRRRSVPPPHAWRGRDDGRQHLGGAPLRVSIQCTQAWYADVGSCATPAASLTTAASEPGITSGPARGGSRGRGRRPRIRELALPDCRCATASRVRPRCGGTRARYRRRARARPGPRPPRSRPPGPEELLAAPVARHRRPLRASPVERRVTHGTACLDRRLRRWRAPCVDDRAPRWVDERKPPVTLEQADEEPRAELLGELSLLCRDAEE